MANTTQDAGPIIAVDMDDVLCMTAAALTDFLEKRTLGNTLGQVHHPSIPSPYMSDCYTETRKKLDTFHRSPAFENVDPVPYAAEGLRGLKDLGFRLKIVTARSWEYREVTEAWTARCFPDTFEEIIFTSNYAVVDDAQRLANPYAGRSKAEVIKMIGAVLLIDDSLENATICAEENIHVLLFGKYQWSRRHSGTSTPQDFMSREERIKAGDHEFWEKEVVTTLPPLIRRVDGWHDVVEWVKGEGKHHVSPGAPLEELEALGEGV
ncbi:hypothetical protein FRB99_008690 [Tulasnella sp. 403]|nr:hypothetical protein FRB99_008690 [Tulasnella sp. 403]